MVHIHQSAKTLLKLNGFKNLFTVLKKLKECVGFFFFNNLIATNIDIAAIYTAHE